MNNNLFPFNLLPVKRDYGKEIIKDLLKPSLDLKQIDLLIILKISASKESKFVKLDNKDAIQKLINIYEEENAWQDHEIGFSPRLNKDLLHNQRKGLVKTTPCYLFMNGSDEEKRKKTLLEFIDSFIEQS